MIHSYQTAVFVGPKDPFQNHDASKIKSVERVISISPRVTPGLAPIGNTEMRNDDYYSNPQISLDINYYTTNGYNERNFGLYTNGVDSLSGANSGFFINLESANPNFFIAVSEIGKEGLKDTSSNKKILGLGNSSLLNYSLQAQVGNLISSSVTFSCFNIASFSGSTGWGLPSIDSATQRSDIGHYYVLPTGSLYSLGLVDYDINAANTINCLGPQDIVLSFPSGSSMFSKQGEYGLNVQSINLSAKTLRADGFSLGKYYPTKRPLSWPIQVSLSVETILSEFELDDLCNYKCSSRKDISIYLKKHCSDVLAMEFHLKGSRLIEYSKNLNVNGRFTTSLEYQVTINDPFDTGNNLFIKACQGAELYVPVSTNYITGENQNGINYFETVTTYRKIITENAL